MSIVLKNPVTKKGPYWHLSFVYSWKANFDVSTIESHLSDTRLVGLFKLIESIQLPELSGKDQKVKYSIYFISFF